MIKKFSKLFYRKAKNGNKERVGIREQNVKGATHDKTTPQSELDPFSEIILTEDEAVGPIARLAHEIINNGIQCKANLNIGSLAIEREPYYSYLFSSSPRIITNRGCITFDAGGKRNIDLMQLIQRN